VVIHVRMGASQQPRRSYAARQVRPGTNEGSVSGDDVADLVGGATLGVKCGGPLGQLPELAAELLEFPDAHL
jgi:hypothetical protein